MRKRTSNVCGILCLLCWRMYSLAISIALTMTMTTTMARAASRELVVAVAPNRAVASSHRALTRSLTRHKHSCHKWMICFSLYTRRTHRTIVAYLYIYSQPDDFGRGHIFLLSSNSIVVVAVNERKIGWARRRRRWKSTEPKRKTKINVFKTRRSEKKSLAPKNDMQRAKANGIVFIFFLSPSTSLSLLANTLTHGELWPNDLEWFQFWAVGSWMIHSETDAYVLSVMLMSNASTRAVNICDLHVIKQ